MAVVLWTLLPLLVLHLWMWWRCPPLLRFQLLLDLGLLAVMAPVWLSGADLNPVRCLEGHSPYTAWEWSETTQYQPTQSDLVLQFHPWWAETRRQLLAGEAPWISDRIGAGLPLFANGQSGLWAPVMVPVWALGPERGSTVMAMWKLELAGLGAFLFLWQGWRLRQPAAAVTALAHGCGTYLVAWLLVPLAWVTAALPWLWWGVAHALRRRSGLRTSVIVGALMGWLLGSGLHPETAAVVIGSSWLAGLVLHPRRWPRLVVMAAVALPVALILSWPTTRYIAASAKVEHYRQHKPNRDGLTSQVRRAALQQTLVPTVNGHPGRGDWQASFPHAAAATGIGGAALALLVAGRVRRRHRRLLLAALACLATALTLAFRVLQAVDAPLVSLPPLDRMSLVRFAVLIPWASALWAGLAMEGALAGRVRHWAWRLLPAAVLGLVALSASPTRLAASSQALVGVTVVLAAAVAVAVRRPRWVASAVAGEMALLALGINPAAAPSERLPRPALIAEIQRREAESPGRVVGLGGVLPPNMASRYGLADLRAYDPLRPLPLSRLLAELGEREPVLGGPLSAAPAGLCGAWSVRFLVAPPAAQISGWQREWADLGAALWRNPLWLPEVRAVGRVIEAEESAGWALLSADRIDHRSVAVVPPGAARVGADRTDVELVERSASRITARVLCDGPCLLVWARPWAPGWHARVDGDRVPMVRANLAALGVVVPAGEHTVAVDYSPWR